MAGRGCVWRGLSVSGQVCSFFLRLFHWGAKQLYLSVYCEVKAPMLRQRSRLDASVCPARQHPSGIKSPLGRTASTNPYHLHHTDFTTACTAFCKPAFWCVELFPINTHRADALIDTDNRCLSAVSLGCGDWHPVWLRSIRGARPLCYRTRGLVSPGSGVKLPSNSPRWMNRRCYMWTGCQNDFVIFSSVRHLKMLTHCVWGTDVLLEVMEAFSLFLFSFLLQTAFIRLGVHSSVRIPISPATDVSWHFLPRRTFRSADQEPSLNIHSLSRILSLTLHVFFILYCLFL